MSGELLQISNNLCMLACQAQLLYTKFFHVKSEHGVMRLYPGFAVKCYLLLVRERGYVAWTLSVCNCCVSKCEQYPHENQSGKKKEKKNNTNLPRRLSIMAEMGLVGIYQIIYHDRRHTLLLVFSDNSCCLKNMTLQVQNFLSALFKNGLKKLPEQKV